MSSIVNICIDDFLDKNGFKHNISGLKAFLTNPCNITIRTVSGGRIIGEGGGTHLLEYIYHHYLTPEQKEVIYCSGYEIGCPIPIPSDSESDFFNYLELTYRGDVEYLIKDIKKNISDLTSIEFRHFLEQDRSLAYKVLSLFYRLRRQHKSQLFSFLTKYKPKKAEYEFRSSYPYKEEKAVSNSAVLAEILGHLTFSMPKDYFDLASGTLANIASAGADMAKFIKSEVDGSLADERYSPANIPVALEYLLNEKKKQDFPKYDRLDFLLYTALTLQEYSRRTQSNALVVKEACETPLNLKSLNRAVLKTFEDKDVLAYLLDKKSIKLKPTLNEQAEFVEQIVLSRRLYLAELPKMNRQIIKALILHDEKHNVTIPSKIAGMKNIQASVTSLLKDAAKSNERLVDFLDYPEALQNYWDIRYELAMKTLFDDHMNIAIENFKKIAELELLVDSKLVEYLSFQDYSAYLILDDLPRHFGRLLGYQKVTS